MEPSLLQTDQTSCFDESGTEIDCRNTGQDGDSKRKNIISAPDRFHVRGDRVADKSTGLIWHKNANLPEFPLSWREAFDFIKEINAKPSGIGEWRLPSRKELFSLVSHQFINPALPTGHPFENVFNGYYWTRTECARLTDQAWHVHLGGARVYRGMKHASYLVWPVAGRLRDPDSAAERFVVDEDSIYDHLYRRHWYAPRKWGDLALTWKEALQMVRELNQKRRTGHHKWRLPNIRELASLIDDEKHSPAFAADFSLQGHTGGCWSSTTSVYESGYAWVLYGVDGAIGVGFKVKADFSATAVRGEPGALQPLHSMRKIHA